MRAYTEFLRSFVLQCVCVSVVLYPVWRWAPVPHGVLALVVGFLLGSGSWLQFERHRRLGANRQPE